MKLKFITVVLAVAAVAYVIGLTACNRPAKESGPANSQTVAYYTCEMHPSVKADKPGPCPICGMNLVPVYTNTPVAKP